MSSNWEVVNGHVVVEYNINRFIIMTITETLCSLANMWNVFIIHFPYIINNQTFGQGMDRLLP